MATPKIVADFETQISSAISVGSTSFTLLSVTDDDAVSLVDGLYYFTVDSGSSNKEYFTGTLTTATKTLASVKSVSRQGTETSGAARAHRVGANIKITDFATYKKYMDEVSIAGASNATTSLQGLVELATQAEVDAATATGGTGASLVATPATMRSHLYHDYVADAGANDAYAITVVPAITAYATGQEFTFKANTLNTGACTLNVCALGAKTIKKNYNEDMATGDILANQVVKVVYDGTNMQYQSPLPTAAPIVRTYLNAASPATWNKPTGLKYIIVECQNAGNGGYGTTSSSTAVQGGDAGGYGRKLIAAASLGSTETVTIGAGGSGGSGAGTPGVGGTGGASSFGSHVSGTTGGDITLPGGSGGSAIQPTGWIISGRGADSQLGRGGNPAITSGSGSVAGAAGGLYGSGGSGGACGSGGSDAAGGAGANGIVIVSEYY